MHQLGAYMGLCRFPRAAPITVGIVPPCVPIDSSDGLRAALIGYAGSMYEGFDVAGWP